MSGVARGDATGRSLVAFVLLAYGLTWLLLAPAVLSRTASGTALSFGAYVLGAFGPSAAGLAVAWREGGRSAARALLARVTRWRVAPRWYLAAVCVPIGLKLGALGALVLAGYPVPTLPDASSWPSVLAVAVVAGLVPGAIGEELGWRGFALPRLQARYDALVASLILGVVWALWHLPTFLVEFTGQAVLPAGPLLVEIVGASVLYAWVVNNARGSVLLAILFHAANNGLTPVVLPGVVEAGYAVAFATATAASVWTAAIAVVWTFGRRSLSRTRPPTTPDD
jgi:membrane protease YdiL (CAAX protease family)